jgi:hypothetical protein
MNKNISYFQINLQIKVKFYNFSGKQFKLALLLAELENFMRLDKHLLR